LSCFAAVSLSDRRGILDIHSTAETDVINHYGTAKPSRLTAKERQVGMLWFLKRNAPLPCVESRRTAMAHCSIPSSGQKKSIAFTKPGNQRPYECMNQGNDEGLVTGDSFCKPTNRTTVAQDVLQFKMG
jgi:hypothetical protein